MNAPRIDRFASGARRLIDRHIFGLTTDPDSWPKPDDLGSIPLPEGIPLDDDAGHVWILDNERLSAWHRLRTVIGAQAFRFEQNEEYDCGWRLVDVAARFLQSHGDDWNAALVAMVPPPPVYTSIPVLPWLGARLATTIDARFVPDLFAASAPYPTHPDVIPHAKMPPSGLFRIKGSSESNLAGVHVLLIDWRYHHGRTLSTLARMLRRSGADVVRFAWLR